MCEIMQVIALSKRPYPLSMKTLHCLVSVSVCQLSANLQQQVPDPSRENRVIVWLASHVLPYLSLWVGCRL